MRDRISELSKKIAEQHHQDVVEELKVVDWCQYGIVDLIWFTEKPGQSTTRDGVETFELSIERDLDKRFYERRAPSFEEVRDSISRHKFEDYNVTIQRCTRPLWEKYLND